MCVRCCGGANGVPTVPCVSPCVHVFFGDDKFLRATVMPARIGARIGYHERIVRLGGMRLATRAAYRDW